MSSGPYTYSTPTLRQWHRSRSRPPSSSSLSSTDASHPSTPQDNAFPPFPSQTTPRPPVLVYGGKSWDQNRDFPTFSRSTCSSEDSSRESSQSFEDEDDGYDYKDISRTRTQTATLATALHHEKPDRMRIPFPGSHQRDSTSSTESNVAPDSASVYDAELGGMPVRHPLRNRVNSKSSSLSFAHADDRSTSPTKPQRGRAYTHRPESTQFTPPVPRTAVSLRLKPKKSHSQRGAMNLFKSLASSPQSTPAAEFEDIEFDWAEQRRGELEKRARLLDQGYDDERKVVQSQAQSDDGKAEATGPLRPRSWELTPQELALRRELEAEDSKRFSFKDRVWTNSSYVSPHSKDAVPYPLAYDKVNLQTDRHSHELVKHIFSGRPSIHDDISHKPPVTVLDLGCGDGSWIVDAAQSWKNTLFYGLDLQKLHPSHAQLVIELGEQAAENLRFTYFNFLNDKLPYFDERFDMVRMANLKWAIPEGKWGFVLGEVNRVLKRGGWVEIIDDDFVLPMSSDSSLSSDQLATCEKAEKQFKDMLQERNLPLNMSREFVEDVLRYHFKAPHEEGFAVTIPKARPVSVDMNWQGAAQVLLPSDGMSHKAAKLIGIGIEDKHLSFGSGRSKSRSRSGSVSSAASHSTRDDASVWSQPLGDWERDQFTDSTKGLTKPRIYQPLGLNVHPGRFIAFSPNELTAHAIRNFQSILASKEAIRANELKKCPELESLEAKDELLPEEKHRFERLSWEWDEQRRAFDDEFWAFECAMLKRLCLPQRFFDIDDDDDMYKPANVLRPRSYRTVSVRSRSHRGSDVSLSSPTPSTFSLASTMSVASTTPSNFSPGSDIPVRFVRIYSGWK